METPAKKPRRTWTRREESQLLQYYLSARSDASLKTDKGIKSKAWTLIVSRLATDGIAADKVSLKVLEAHDRLAGDTRATAEDADTIQAFDVRSLLEADKTDKDSGTGPAETTVASELEPPSTEEPAPSQPFPTLFSPSSSTQRTDRIKRYRKGRKKAKEGGGTSISTSAGDEAKASVVSFMKTAEAYFLMKMKAMAREHDSDKEEGEANNSETYQEVLLS
ncbi:hypothetical protein PR002_g7007 [Phytophthora rubi]|uniref:Myb-like domain-containing protein n=1 Tax=Phytophthora rubi TaxID=129364 RepID=A0A6A3N4S8_9STRA|nr:hypothetical protein PR002_g7007 [Phytophthora rubi]